MGFLDNVSAFTKGVGAKAKGNYDVVALNTQISSCKKEIAALHANLGELYFNLHRNDPEDKLAGIVNEIISKEKKIEELNQQIETTKEATAAVQFTAPTEPTVPDDYTGRRCSNCGAPLADDAIFCGECGTKNEIIETKEEEKEEIKEETKEEEKEETVKTEE